MAQAQQNTFDVVIDKDAEVKLTYMGNVTELLYMSKKNTKATIKMLPGGNQYIELSSGEVKDVCHHVTRATQYKSLARTFRNLRHLINSNITNVKNVRWITLTYAENMTDKERLYKDFEKFNKRFQYWIKNNTPYEKAEYITVVEPQGRGAWHMHCIYIFDYIAPYIDNDTVLFPMWSHGWTKCQKLKDVDNVGAYLTAYLGDIPLSECSAATYDYLNKHIYQDGSMRVGGVKEIIDDKGNKKQYIKGGRLELYPANLNLYRCSRGIVKPTEELMTYKKALKKVRNQQKTFEKVTRLSDKSTDFESTIVKKHYNKKTVKQKPL